MLKHVLIVEPDELQANGMRVALQAVNRNIWVATHLLEAVRAMKTMSFDYIISEVSFSYIDPLAALEEIQIHSGAAQLILLSTSLRDAQSLEKSRYRILDILEKPVNLDKLKELLV